MNSWWAGIPSNSTPFRQACVAHFGDAGAAARGAAPWDGRRMAYVYSTIEVACFDIMGKVIGRPVCDLLGGRARDRVDFSAYLFYKYEGAGGSHGFGTVPTRHRLGRGPSGRRARSDGLVAQARAMCDEFGFKSIKLKGGVMPPDEEADAMVALQQAFGPGTPLRLDPNAVWSVETSIRVGKRLDRCLGISRGSDARPGEHEQGRPRRRYPAGHEHVHGLLRRPSRQCAAPFGGHHPQRPSRLGRPTGIGRACPDLPHLRSWSVDALQQSCRDLPGRHGAPCRSHAQLDLCLRHPLPLAIRRSRERGTTSLRRWRSRDR